MTNNSTQTNKNSTKFDADRSIRALQKRVEELERVVAEIQTAAQTSAESLSDAQRKKRGPKPRKGMAILSDRDQLVQMLESYWPEIEPHCSPKPNARALNGVLIAIREKMQGRFMFFADHLLLNLPVLLQFLSSNRFRSDPRQIANALAGVPHVSFWTSLRICQGTPCNAPIGDRAIRAYLRRKHRLLYVRFSEDDRLLSFVVELKKYQTRDSRLHQFSPKSLQAAWKSSLFETAS